MAPNHEGSQFYDYSHSNLIFLKSAKNRLLTSWDVYFSLKKFIKQQSLTTIVQACWSVGNKIYKRRTSTRANAKWLLLGAPKGVGPAIGDPSLSTRKKHNFNLKYSYSFLNTPIDSFTIKTIYFD